MYKFFYFLIIMTAINVNKSIYDFNVKDISGKNIELSAYRGKVLLIVNTASECGFTPQYKDLEELYQKYKDQGFCVLAFPSNDFGEQEPLEGKQIHEFCTVNFKTTFPIFNKIHVKGKNADPLFKFLSNKSQNGSVDIAPKWNFQKYLIGKDGKVVDYFLSTTSPMSERIKRAIEYELKK